MTRHSPVSQSLRTSRGVPGLLALGLLLFHGCAKPPIEVHDEGLKQNPKRYLRYTLRGKPDGYYITTHASNRLADPPMFKAGTEAKILLYSAVRIDFKVAGSECRMYAGDLPFPTSPEGIQQVIEMHFAATQEELFLEGVEPEDRQKIDSGEVAIGMSKRDVLFSLGCPSHIDEYSPVTPLNRDGVHDSSKWIYRYSVLPLKVHTSYWTCRFDEEGTLIEVIR